MQLGASQPDPRTAQDLAAALRLATARRGHRPALTVLGAGPAGDRRDEQAVASLAQWAAKGAHLLEVDLGLGPGARLCLDAPPGWLPAAVCLATWWVGACVVGPDADGADAVVAHEARGRDDADWVLGDLVDGSPAGPAAAAAWSLEVQAFPDQPPVPRAAAGLPALATDGGVLDQAALLAAARALPGGRLGCRAPLPLAAWVVRLAARPAATGDPTVLVAGPHVDESSLPAEAVTTWA